MAQKHAAKIISIKEASARLRAERSARLKAVRRAASRAAPRRVDRERDPRWMALLRLVLVLGLVVGGLLLVRELRSASQLQDCVLAGRSNCAPIDVQPSH